ncbi:MAG: hypothetical protein NT007_09545 [Candidatus Kapabacteria bacterium]|nr:hypothetical protein [Candidatus Kapabacteria bacterium]
MFGSFQNTVNPNETILSSTTKPCGGQSGVPCGADGKAISPKGVDGAVNVIFNLNSQNTSENPFSYSESPVVQNGTIVPPVFSNATIVPPVFQTGVATPVSNTYYNTPQGGGVVNPSSFTPFTPNPSNHPSAPVITTNPGAAPLSAPPSQPVAARSEILSNGWT